MPRPLIVPQRGVVPPHTLHVVPLPPQSLADVPAAHTWPLVQQPVAQEPQASVPPQPLEMLPHCPAGHVVMGVHPHTPGVPPPPQVFGEVHSELTVQPHLPPDSHVVPFGLPTQVTHAPPLGPQAVWELPGWQLVPSQHWPLHVSPPEQLVLHVLPDEQAEPTGQSPAAPHPQVPPSWQT